MQFVFMTKCKNPSKEGGGERKDGDDENGHRGSAYSILTLSSINE
jgi:hypothetical protein